LCQSDFHGISPFGYADFEPACNETLKTPLAALASLLQILATLSMCARWRLCGHRITQHNRAENFDGLRGWPGETGDMRALQAATDRPRNWSQKLAVTTWTKHHALPVASALQPLVKFQIRLHWRACRYG
jgi:hypothetical protein